MAEAENVVGPQTTETIGASGARARGERRSGFRLGKVAGIEVWIDWSLGFIFLLILVNLGAGLFRAQHPGWSPLLSWAVALVAACLFFASVLAHELAHAIVGRRRGVPIERITLFIFGGLAELKAEPKSPHVEFTMAIVGPLTSLGIGILSLLVGSAFVGVPFNEEDPRAFIAALGPVPTLLFWLGPINIFLALFNLLPGFPLDGGRVLRAILWRATGDLERATRWASGIGRALAFLLIFAGALMAFGRSVPILGRGFAQGLWLIFIGWFLDAAARQSYQHLVVRRLFGGQPVSRLMRPGAVSGGIEPRVTLATAAERFLDAPASRCLPVMESGRLLGLVCLADLGKAPRQEWSTLTVGDVMTPLAALAIASPSDEVVDAFAKLADRDVDQLPVVQNGEVRGFLRRTDVIRWLELQHAGA